MTGRVILVTGAAKRIGRGIALRLAQEGARVAIHYDRSEAEARRTAAECGGAEIFRANLEKRRRDRAPLRRSRRPPGPPRRAGQQRRPLHPVRPARHHRKGLGLHPLGQPEGGLLLLPARRAAHAEDRRRPDRQYQLARRHTPLGRACALLRVEGGGHHADPRAGQGLRAGDHGQLGGPRGDSLRGYRRPRQGHDRGDSGGPRRHPGGGRGRVFCTS